MTVPPAMRRISDMVRETIPFLRWVLTPEETALAVHLRGNEKLLKDLTALIRSRIEVRDHRPVPSDPLMCKGFMERNAELRWLISRLELVHRSPSNTEAAQAGEQPGE